MPVEEMRSREPVDLAGAALSHRQAAATRPQGTAIVRTFTPTVEQHGWSAGHTVIEIITDDMPFLVDSVISELNRLGCGIHLIVHPQLVVRRTVTGELLEVLEPSPDRVAPRCAHFGVCGGCALQHLAPEAQRVAKQAELAEALQRIGRVTPETWFEPLAGPRWGYRRRARLGAKFVAKRGRVLVGFRERQKPYVAALERCEILAAPVDALIEPLATMLTGFAAREAIPQIEVAVADAAVALVFRVLSELPAADLDALRAFERAHGVSIYLQPGGLDTVRPLSPPAPRLSYALPRFDLDLEFEPIDFIQVNGALNRELVAREPFDRHAHGGGAAFAHARDADAKRLDFGRRPHAFVPLSSDSSDQSNLSSIVAALPLPGRRRMKSNEPSTGRHNSDSALSALGSCQESPAFSASCKLW
jgi:hypothetical protein